MLHANFGDHNYPYAQPVPEYLTDLYLEILDLLRNNTQGAELLAETLSQQREQIGSRGVLSRLDEMTSRGLVRPSVSPRRREMPRTSRGKARSVGDHRGRPRGRRVALGGSTRPLWTRRRR